MVPNTPSEARGRIYHRVIVPTIKTRSHIELTENESSELLMDLLKPTDLTNYPTTFGPIDDDPLFALSEIAKPYDRLDINEVWDGTAGRNALRAARDEIKRYDGLTLMQRIGPEDPEPIPEYLRPFSPVLTAKSMREVAKIAEDATIPRKASQFFLPSSKHFCTGYLQVENVETPRVTVEDALNLRWRIDGEVTAKDIRGIMAPADPPKKPLSDIWERWDAMEADDIPTFEEPIFPAHGPRATEWRLSTAWIGSQTPFSRAPSVTPQMFLDEAALEVGEDDAEDPLSDELFDEFDPEAFDPLSESTKPTRGHDPIVHKYWLRREVDPNEEELVSWTHNYLQFDDDDESITDELPGAQHGYWQSSDRTVPPAHAPVYQQWSEPTRFQQESGMDDMWEGSMTGAPMYLPETEPQPDEYTNYPAQYNAQTAGPYRTPTSHASSPPNYAVTPRADSNMEAQVGHDLWAATEYQLPTTHHPAYHPQQQMEPHPSPVPKDSQWTATPRPNWRYLNNTSQTHDMPAFGTPITTTSDPFPRVAPYPRAPYYRTQAQQQAATYSERSHPQSSPGPGPQRLFMHPCPVPQHSRR